MNDGGLIDGSLLAVGSFIELEQESTLYDSDDADARALWSRQEGSIRRVQKIIVETLNRVFFFRVTRKRTATIGSPWSSQGTRDRCHCEEIAQCVSGRKNQGTIKIPTMAYYSHDSFPPDIVSSPIEEQRGAFYDRGSS